MAVRSLGLDTPYHPNQSSFLPFLVYIFPCLSEDSLVKMKISSFSTTFCNKLFLNTNYEWNLTYCLYSIQYWGFQILWNKEEEFWFDYDIVHQQSRNYFYLSNFVPLWTKSYRFQPMELTRIVINYIAKHNLLHYPGLYLRVIFILYKYIILRIII